MSAAITITDKYGNTVDWCRQHSLKDIQQQVSRFAGPTRLDDDHA